MYTLFSLKTFMKKREFTTDTQAEAFFTGGGF
jgi:hypothetical protein